MYKRQIISLSTLELPATTAVVSSNIQTYQYGLELEKSSLLPVPVNMTPNHADKDEIYFVICIFGAQLRMEHGGQTSILQTTPRPFRPCMHFKLE